MEKDTKHLAAYRSDLATAFQSQELKAGLATLQGIAPEIGLAITMTDYKGDNYSLTNRRMKLFSQDDTCFPGAEKLLSMQYGNRFRTLEIFARGLETRSSIRVRSALICAALEVTGALDRTGQSSMAA